MTIEALSAATAGTGQNAGTTQLARGKLSETYDNFLKLLTTQLKNQDPLQPMDSAEFTNQLVLYSQVEQQISQNEKLEKLLTLQNASQTQASLGFIGLDVEVEGKDFDFQGQPVQLGYELPTAATGVQVRVADAQGRTVQTLTAERTAGSHQVTWDGKTATGATAPAGTYSLVVGAVDAQNQPIPAKTTVSGRVTGIEAGNGDTVLLMGSVPVKLDQVRSAHSPAPRTQG